MEIFHPVYYLNSFHSPAPYLLAVFHSFPPLHPLYRHPVPSQLQVQALKLTEHPGSIPIERQHKILIQESQ